MPPLLHKMIRVFFKALLVFVCTVLVLLTIAVILAMYEDTMRSRYLDRLQRETKVPTQLVTAGEHPLTSLFIGSEDRICVFEPYASGHGLDEMSAEQLKAVQELELPSEDGIWYLVAFQRDKLVRVLLITIRDVELASKPMCFFRHQSGVIQVLVHQRDYLPLRSVELHLKGE